MPRILGIDPGNTQTAVVLWNGTSVLTFAILKNEGVCNYIFGMNPDAVAIEQVRGFGLKAGNELFDTCWWSGRFFQFCTALLVKCVMLPRKTVVVHLCDQPRAGDTEIRAALIERIGPVGTKKTPGPMLGLTSSDLRAALAVAVTYYDSMSKPEIIQK